MYISPSRFGTRSGAGNIQCYQGHHLSPPPFPFPLSFCQVFPADGVSMGSCTVLLKVPGQGSSSFLWEQELHQRWARLSLAHRPADRAGNSRREVQEISQSLVDTLRSYLWQSSSGVLASNKASAPGGKSRQSQDILQCLLGQWRMWAAGWKSYLWGLRSTPRWPARAVGKHTAHVQDTSSSCLLPAGPSSLSLPAQMSWLPQQLFRW